MSWTENPCDCIPYCLPKYVIWSLFLGTLNFFLTCFVPLSYQTNHYIKSQSLTKSKQYHGSTMPIHTIHTIVCLFLPRSIFSGVAKQWFKPTDNFYFNILPPRGSFPFHIREHCRHIVCYLDCLKNQ